MGRLWQITAQYSPGQQPSWVHLRQARGQNKQQWPSGGNRWTVIVVLSIEWFSWCYCLMVFCLFFQPSWQVGSGNTRMTSTKSSRTRDQVSLRQRWRDSFWEEKLLCGVNRYVCGVVAYHGMMKAKGKLALEDNSEVGEAVLSRCSISCIYTSVF